MHATPSNSADRYFTLIEATLREGLARPLDAWVHWPADEYPMAAALVPLAKRLDFGAPRPDLLELAMGRMTTAKRFVDGSGHQRPIYAMLVARALSSAGLPVSLVVQEPSSPVTAIFIAWASTGMSVPLMPHGQAISRLQQAAKIQQPEGTFLPRNQSDSLEPQWYDELAILHALSCYASEADDAEVGAAVSRAVRYHAAETQPDHASSHPWALAAFLAEPDAIPLADMMLHAAGVQQPSTMDAVSLLLLADALDCGRRRASR